MARDFAKDTQFWRVVEPEELVKPGESPEIMGPYPKRSTALGVISRLGYPPRWHLEQLQAVLSDTGEPELEWVRVR